LLALHEASSGSDAAFHRGGVVFLQGSKNIQIADCEFQYLGSNALFISNYGRNIDIVRNRFFALDQSGIVIAGDALFQSNQPWNRTNDAEYVSGVTITYNTGRNFGLSAFQTFAVYLSICKDITIENNVFYTGPRSAICYGDVFGGNYFIRKNLIFNFVTITADHGPFNSWDRQRWLLPSNFRKPSYIENNFMLSHPNGPKMIDLDDGARDYYIRKNLVVGGFMKIKGDHVQYDGNVILPDQMDNFCVLVTNNQMQPAYQTWTNNICFLAKSAPYLFLTNGNVAFDGCNLIDFLTANNTYYGFYNVLDINTVTLSQAGSTFDFCGGYPKWIGALGQDAKTKFNATQSSTLNTFNICNDHVVASNF